MRITPNAECFVCGDPLIRETSKLVNGYQPHCSSCRPEAMRRRWQDKDHRTRLYVGRNPGPIKTHEERKRYMRDKALERKFGITREQYNEILETQGGVCAICGEECSSGRALAVDHDHETGRVRGLLCAFCNRGLGLFKDSPAMMLKAALYLGPAEYLP